jgi:hypothetical protein
MPSKKKTAAEPATTPAASPAPAASPPVPPAPTPPPATTPITSVANGSNTGTKVDLQTSYLALISGLESFYQSGDVFQLVSGPMTRDELITQFQQFIADAEATKASYQAWRDDVQHERVSEQAAGSLRAGVKAILNGRFGKSGTQLTKFGFEPAKTGAKTPLVKAVAAVKAKATRAARGTKGSEQKKLVKGNVTGVVITPVTEPAPATASNAASGSSGTGAPPAAASPAATGGTPPHS